MRSKGTAAEMERRRRLAMERLQEGRTQREVAQFLGVSERSVRRWVSAFRQSGPAGLAAKPNTGRPARLTKSQAAIVLSWFRQSPRSFGFANDLWTAPRVAQLIQKTFGVVFHPRYLNAWLTDRQITPQKPKRRPTERNEAKINGWIRDQWPAILKKGPKKTPTWS
jgi:transposase